MTFFHLSGTTRTNMDKNTSGQSWTLIAFDSDNALISNGAANITAQISKDDGSFVNTATTNPTSLGGGLYTLPLSQAETDADKLVLKATSSTSGVTVIACPTVIYTGKEYRERILSKTEYNATFSM